MGDARHVPRCQVDGVVMGTTPLVPSQLVQGWAWQGGSGRHLLQTPGTSLFFFQFIAPTTPGAHNVTVIVTVTGASRPLIGSQVRAGALIAYSEGSHACTGMLEMKHDTCACKACSAVDTAVARHVTQPLPPCSRPPDSAGHADCGPDLWQ